MNSAKNFDWKVSGEDFVRQLERFETLFGPDIENGPVGSLLAPPEKVLHFARNLTLCATEQAAASCIELDREAGRGCYLVSNELATANNRESVQFLIPEPPVESPFFLLASIAMARAQLAIKRNGNSWVHHSESPNPTRKA